VVLRWGALGVSLLVDAAVVAGRFWGMAEVRPS
jgi:hypothetical protein